MPQHPNSLFTALQAAPTVGKEDRQRKLLEALLQRQGGVRAGAPNAASSQRQLAQQQIRAGSQGSPVAHPLQAVNRALQGVVGGLGLSQARAQEQQQRQAQLARSQASAGRAAQQQQFINDLNTRKLDQQGGQFDRTFGLSEQNILSQISSRQSADRLAKQKAEDPSQAPLTVREEEREKQLGKRDVKLLDAKPKAFNAIKAQERQTDIVIRTIDKILPRIDKFTAGFGGQVLSNFGGTDARDVAADLDTIKANIGFDKLSEMRANSPTGGALGQVSDRENILLQSVIGALDQSQTPEQMFERLSEIRERLNALKSQRRAAFRKDFGGGQAPATGVKFLGFEGS